MTDQVDYFNAITTSDTQVSKFEAKVYLQRFAIATSRRETHKAMHDTYPITNPVPTPSGVVIKNVVTGVYRLVPRQRNSQNKLMNGDFALVDNFTTGDWKVVSNWALNRPGDFPDIGGVAQTVDANTNPNRWDG